LIIVSAIHRCESGVPPRYLDIKSPNIAAGRRSHRAAFMVDDYSFGRNDDQALQGRKIFRPYIGENAAPFCFP
jgi:hypothetical protein